MLRSQYSAIVAYFRRKNSVLIKNQCYDHIFAQSSCSLSKKTANFLCQNFRRKYFKNHNIGPLFSRIIWPKRANPIADCAANRFLGHPLSLEKNVHPVSCQTQLMMAKAAKPPFDLYLSKPLPPFSYSPFPLQISDGILHSKI
jgi:hypothetical protein